jgi:hypothetical protein
MNMLRNMPPIRGGLGLALFASLFVATRELLASGTFNVWGVLLTGATAFIFAAVALAAVSRWSRTSSSGS